jgi:ABC-type lipopolysaccharide export system ATPase subunit
MKKTILCLFGPANTGKTSTIRRVDEILQSYGAKLVKVLFDENDFSKEYLFRTHKIGILSLGDPGSEQSDYLRQLSNDNCEIIICTSRSKGATCDAVTAIATNGYERYWISPLYEYDSRHPLSVDMHELNAEFIIKAIFAAFQY